jgi:type VI secretion system secreted protein VgrG
MPSAKDGTECSVLAPTDPTEAHDADTADPGEVESIKAQQRQTGTGKYGSQPVDPYKPPEPTQQQPVKTTWIEILLVDAHNKPVPGETYKCVMPDNKVKVGTLDAKGFARIDGIEDGQCQISFPKLDKDAWEPA